MTHPFDSSLYLFDADSIIVRAYEDRTDLLRSLIIGPENTPYQDAPFVIDWMLDSNFPQSPPKAHFLSWTNGNGRGTCRIHDAHSHPHPRCMICDSESVNLSVPFAENISTEPRMAETCTRKAKSASLFLELGTATRTKFGAPPVHRCFRL